MAQPTHCKCVTRMAVVGDRLLVQVNEFQWNDLNRITLYDRELSPVWSHQGADVLIGAVGSTAFSYEIMDTTH